MTDAIDDLMEVAAGDDLTITFSDLDEPLAVRVTDYSFAASNGKHTPAELMVHCDADSAHVRDGLIPTESIEIWAKKKPRSDDWDYISATVWDPRRPHPDKIIDDYQSLGEPTDVQIDD